MERRSCAEKSCRVVTQSFDEYFGSLADIRWLKFVQNGIGASFRVFFQQGDSSMMSLVTGSRQRSKSTSSSKVQRPKERHHGIRRRNRQVLRFNGRQLVAII